MKTRVRRIGARSVFLLLAVIYGFVGLVVGVALALLAQSEISTPMVQTAIDRLGWWSAVLFPLGYGVVGGLAGAAAAVLYNFAAGLTGGIRVELRVRSGVGRGGDGEEDSGG